MVIFLYHSSWAIAMHPEAQASDSRSKLFAFFETIVNPSQFLEIFQKDERGTMKKLEIAHSKINPKLFRKAPSTMKELSLSTVTDLNGNILSSRHFLNHTDYFNHLEVLSLKSQHINDAKLSIIAQMEGIKILNL